MSCVSTRQQLVCFFLALISLAVEERIFSINQPQSFFTMFGNSGGAASEDLAMEAFEDDLKLTGRGVSLHIQ